MARAGYAVEGELGRGASAVVYLARQPLLDRHVALKRIAFDPATDEALLRRVDVEVAALVQLEHPGLVRLMDLVRCEESVFIVMEYVNGPTLRSVLDLSAGALAPADAMATLEALSAVLEHVSRKGIVHRDLKPANVFLTEDGRCKLGDFGVASLLRSDSGAAEGLGRITRPGTVLGTPAYLSPEQARGDGQLDGAADVYSLGVLAYELLVGRVPFPYSGNVIAVLAAHLAEPPPRPRSIRPTLTRQVEDAVLAGLEKDAGRRPRSAAVFWAELERAADAAWAGWRAEADLGRLARECRIRALPLEAEVRPGEEPPAPAAGTIVEDVTTGRDSPGPAPPPCSPPTALPSQRVAPVAPPPLTGVTESNRGRRPQPSSRSGWASVRTGPGRWFMIALVFAVAAVGTFLIVRALHHG